jgi:hypothetical protein
MKDYALPTLAFLLCLSSCQPATTEQKEVMEAPSVYEAITGKLCFAYDHEDDLIGLTIQMTGNSFTGQLAYAYREKDRNAGTIVGQMKGDTLIADYTFSSEGRRSVREVVFLKRGDTLIEGFGDVEQRDGKTVFKNRSALKFESNTPLKAVPCHK